MEYTETMHVWRNVTLKQCNSGSICQFPILLHGHFLRVVLVCFFLLWMFWCFRLVQFHQNPRIALSQWRDCRFPVSMWHQPSTCSCKDKNKWPSIFRQITKKRDIFTVLPKTVSKLQTNDGIVTWKAICSRLNYVLIWVCVWMWVSVFRSLAVQGIYSISIAP